MTDTDYHSHRKPITLVIVAPSGPLSVEWNALQNSLCILLATFCISSMLIPPHLSVNSAVNGTLPRLRALSGSDELLLHKAGRSCLLEKRMNYILLRLSSFYIQDKAFFYFVPFLTALSQRPWITREWGSKVAELWRKRHFYEQNKQQLIKLLLSLILFYKTVLLLDQRSWNHTQQRCILAMYKDFRSSRVPGERSVCVHVPLCIFTHMLVFPTTFFQFTRSSNELQRRFMDCIILNNQWPY